MENMKIRNDNLALYLGFKLNKMGNEFDAKDLATLKELNMNQLNDFGEVEEVDIEVLDYTENLESLVLKNFNVDALLIERINKNKNLKSVSFENCKITDFDIIGNLDIDYLSITNCPTLRTDFLKGKKYKGLILSGSQLIDIENIKDMDELEYLHISNSHIENRDAIGNLTNLSTLHIEGTDINDISFIKDMPNLKKVGLDRNLYNDSISFINSLSERNIEFLENGYIPLNHIVK